MFSKALYLSVLLKSGLCGKVLISVDEHVKHRVIFYFQVDVFKIEAADLGRIYKIHIRHDNSGFSPAWYLQYIEIVDNSENEKYMFHCERWLAKNKDDSKIERSFYVKVEVNLYRMAKF